MIEPVINFKSRLNGRLVSQFLFFLVVMMMASCSSYRKTIKEPIRTHGTEYLIEQMAANEITTPFISARFTAEVTQNRERFSVNGQLRLQKDSIIWLTISPALGIEMGRLIITADSVKWMNRMQSNFMLAKLEEFTRQLHPLLDFDLLQALILGNDLTLYDDTQFRSSIDSREYKLSVMQRRKLKKQMMEDETVEAIPMQHIWLDPETFRITRVTIRDLQDKDARIEADYERFTPLNGFLFASKQSFNIQWAGNRMMLNITFSRLDTPETLSFPYTIPDKYTPVSNN